MYIYTYTSYAPIAQLVRASVLCAEGRRFEPVLVQYGLKPSNIVILIDDYF